MQEVEDYIYQQSTQQQELLWYFHDLMMAHPHVTCKIRYRVPFYYRKSWICYLTTKKDDKIEVNFLRGDELSNVQGILDFRDRKQVAGFLVGDLNEIPEEALHEVIQEALLLDETVKYVHPGKRT